MEIPTEQNSRHEFWQEQMAAWKQSGLSGAKFCKVHDLNYSQFVYWRQKIHKGEVETKPTDQKQRRGFSQVLYRPEPAEGLSLSLP